MSAVEKQEHGPGVTTEEVTWAEARIAECRKRVTELESDPSNVLDLAKLSDQLDEVEARVSVMRERLERRTA